MTGHNQVPVAILMNKELSLTEIARRLDGELDGDPDLQVSAVAGLREAQSGDLSFLSNPRYNELLGRTEATAVLVHRNTARTARCAMIRVDDPDTAFARATSWFVPPPVTRRPGIDASAIIAETATLGDGVHIGPNVVVEEQAVIGDRCVVLAGAVVAQAARIGADSLLHAGVVVRENVLIGARAIIHNNTVIGSDGFGFTVNDDGRREKIPQLGTVRVGNDVEIGANCCIDRARFGETRIGNGVKIDNLVQIGHNAVIADHAVLVAQVGISGSSLVGPRAILAGQVGVAGHLRIGADARVGGQSGVFADVADGAYVWGTPAVQFREASRSAALNRRLPRLRKQLQELDQRLARLEKQAKR